MACRFNHLDHCPPTSIFSGLRIPVIHCECASSHAGVCCRSWKEEPKPYVSPSHQGNLPEAPGMPFAPSRYWCQLETHIDT